MRAEDGARFDVNFMAGETVIRRDLGAGCICHEAIAALVKTEATYVVSEIREVYAAKAVRVATGEDDRGICVWVGSEL
jgi:hypothetical protein